VMIHNVYEKAIYEPSFGAIYAELCVRLSRKTRESPFVKIIESDEEPKEDGTAYEIKEGESNSGITVYRWTNNVSTNETEVCGPFNSPDECIAAALEVKDCSKSMVKIGVELVLHSLKIRQGLFVKIMMPVEDPNIYYTVYFPMNMVEKVGQPMSKIFLSEKECVTDGTKKNGFKRILLNECEDEFNKQNIFADWKKEKREFDENKLSYPEKERASKEEDLEYRRIKLKKQMLGNIRFIGELYKQDMLKGKIMRYCIHSLLKLEENKGMFKNLDDDEMDEEDHEALCKLFMTIGSTIDTERQHCYMKVYFDKMSKMSTNKKLSSRSRFMYKDLIELRYNRWVARREEETAKTLDEIKKDFERDERLAAQQSMPGGRGAGKGGGVRSSRSDHRDGIRGSRGDNRDREHRSRNDRDNFRKDANQYGNNGVTKSQKDKAILKSDDDGFIKVGKYGLQESTYSLPASSQIKSKVHASPRIEPLTKEKLELKVKNMKAEFMQDTNNIKELLLTMDELKSTPKLGETVVKLNADVVLDCKDQERTSIVKMLSVLFKQNKLSCSDFEEPIGELVEFIDSFMIDSPNALCFLALMLSEFVQVKALNIGWLCFQTEKLRQTSAKLIPEVIGKTMDFLIKHHGLDTAREAFLPHKDALGNLLGEKLEEVCFCKLR